MKLTEKNDWGNITFKIGDEPFAAPARWVSIKLKSRWYRFKVDWRDESYPVSDMGHSYSVTNKMPYVYIDYKGVSIMVPLTKFSRQEMKVPA